MTCCICIEHTIQAPNKPVVHVKYKCSSNTAQPPWLELKTHMKHRQVRGRQQVQEWLDSTMLNHQVSVGWSITWVWKTFSVISKQCDYNTEKWPNQQIEQINLSTKKRQPTYLQCYPGPKWPVHLSAVGVMSPGWWRQGWPLLPPQRWSGLMYLRRCWSEPKLLQTGWEGTQTMPGN